jgi:phage-related protein
MPEPILARAKCAAKGLLYEEYLPAHLIKFGGIVYTLAVLQCRMVLVQSMDVSQAFDRMLSLCQYGHSAGRMKKLAWLADSRANVKSFPAGVRDDVGYALYAAQLGEMSPKAKPLHGLGSGVMEIAVNDESGTWRTVYTVSIGDSIYVVHAFQKKSKSGIATALAMYSRTWACPTPANT